MSDHYYTENPTSNLKTKVISGILRGTEITCITASGVFGKDKFDKGTSLLIEAAQIPEKASVLDLGCGYGVIGIALKKTHPSISVIATDINDRAVSISRQNAIRNNVTIEVRKSDLFKNVPELFDTILVNLPQNAGKEICEAMINQSFDHMHENSTLQIVSRHQKGGKSYEKMMHERFGNCEYIGKGSGYRVYLSKK